MARKESKLFDLDEDDTDSKPVKKMKKNDLIDDSGTSEMPELVNTLKAVAKYGFSKETVKKTRKNNLCMREKLNLTDLEYLILTILLTKISRKFCSETITNFVHGDKYI